MLAFEESTGRLRVRVCVFLYCELGERMNQKERDVNSTNGRIERVIEGELLKGGNACPPSGRALFAIVTL